METIIQPAISVASDFNMRTEHNITFLVCEPLERAGFKNAFSTRFGGASPLPKNALNLGFFSGDSRENVIENRRRFLQAIGAADRTLVTARQIHSAELRIVKTESEISLPSPDCDGVVAKQGGIVAGVFTADCTPVLIGDPVTGAFAAVHAGWRGTVNRIVEKSVNTLSAEFGIDPKDCVVAIGPAAGRCCYQVGPDVIEQFQRELDYAVQLFSDRHGDKANLDVVGANVHQLLHSGIRPENIHNCGLCTMCRPDLFFSYRMEKSSGAVGRMLSVIGIN
jgi:YfiH family protein